MNQRVEDEKHGKIWEQKYRPCKRPRLRSTSAWHPRLEGRSGIKDPAETQADYLSDRRR
jgi:hypothetical protein